MDRAFLIVLSRVIGLRFFGGPFFLYITVYSSYTKRTHIEVQHPEQKKSPLTIESDRNFTLSTELFAPCQEVSAILS